MCFDFKFICKNKLTLIKTVIELNFDILKIIDFLKSLSCKIVIMHISGFGSQPQIYD